MVPSGRVMVASVPVTPAPAVTGPFTGGQYVAQVPVHFEVVDVSGANQYSVNPAALVTTVVPPIVVVFSADPVAAADVAAPAGLDVTAPAGLDAAAPAGVGDELLHPAASSASTASPATPAYLPNMKAPYSR
jgi:hypothetical protein